MLDLLVWLLLLAAVIVAVGIVVYAVYFVMGQLKLPDTVSKGAAIIVGLLLIVVVILVAMKVGGLPPAGNPFR